jgi:hypothetical protein
MGVEISLVYWVYARCLQSYQSTWSEEDHIQGVNGIPLRPNFLELKRWLTNYYLTANRRMGVELVICNGSILGAHEGAKAHGVKKITFLQSHILRK